MGCVPSRACTTILGAVCGSLVNTVRSLAWELQCIRTLSLAHCSPSWYWRCCRVCSAPVCHWELLYADELALIADTREECISRYGRLAWKVKGYTSTQRPISWSPVLTLMSCRKRASIPVLSTARVSAVQLEAVGTHEVQRHHWSTGGWPKLHLLQV